MTTREEKRLFIGGLVKGVTDEELVEKFSRFGEVSKVEVKTRTTDTNESKTFAYLNLTAEDSAFKKCFTAYNNSKWKGGQLTVQWAKESFLSKLKKEQAEEVSTPQETAGHKPSPPVHKSPALRPGLTAAPGTPLDDKGRWVMGKYSRVLPVLHLKKPGSRKLVTVDPSKLTHCLKKLKCEDYNAEEHQDLTWRMEDNSSDINRRRQGQFPHQDTARGPPPPRASSTPKDSPSPHQPSIFSRLQGLAAEEQVSDTELEVVPVGQGRAVPGRQAALSAQDSDDSLSSADTDDIVATTSGKKTSASSSGIRSTDSVIQKRGVKSGGDRSAPSQTPHSDVVPCKTSRQNRSAETLRAGQESGLKGKERDREGGERNSRPQFQFVKTTPGDVKGKVWKRSAAKSHRNTVQEKSSEEEEEEEEEDRKKDTPMTTVRRAASSRTPEFKGLGMLSTDSDSDSDSDTCPRPARSTDSGKGKGHNSPAEVTLSSSRRLTEMTSSPSRSAEVTSSSRSAEVTSSSSRSAEVTSSSRSAEVTSSSSRSAKVTSSSRSAEVTLSSSRSADKRKKEDGVAMDVTVSKKRKRSYPVSSEDSDLDDNDLEKVGKKLATRALQQQEKRMGNSVDKGPQRTVLNTSRETVLNTSRETVLNASSMAVGNGDVAKKRKASQGEEEHLTAMQRSHKAYSKTQQELKRKEDLITKTLREGTGSTHVKFSSEESEDDKEEGASPKKAGKVTLFGDDASEDDDSDSDVDFSLRPQFEGKKGKQLFELHSGIMDKRFRLDERFQSDSDGNSEAEPMQQDSGSDGEMAKEKEQNMKILEKVLGHKPQQRTQLAYQEMSKKRYNPNSAQHGGCKETPGKRLKTDCMDSTNPSERDAESDVEMDVSNPHHDAEAAPSSLHSQQEEDSASKGQEDSASEGQEDSASEGQEDSASEEGQKNSTAGQEVQGNSASEQSGDHNSASAPAVSAPKGDNLKALFSGGSSFTFFGAPQTEEKKEATFSLKAEAEEDEDDDTGYEEEEEEEDNDMSVPSDSRQQEAGRVMPPLQQQPSFMVARDDPRLLAAVKFFQRPPAEDFEDLCQRWPEERQKIMQVVKDRHKKACRKHRQLRQGARSPKVVKTKTGTFTKGRK